MDDGESNQEKPKSLNNDSHKKPSASIVDRLKRDEWSEGAVSSLLEAYESKWVLRNRAKLKGQDWEDVARHVSSRSSHTKSPKTQTQCKNKIESMKKRYRSESATADVSSWPLYDRLDHLLRGTASTSVLPQPQPVLPLNCSVPLLLLEPSPAITHPPQPPAAATQISYGSNGVGKTSKDDGFKPKTSEEKSEKATEMETDSSTPVICREKAKVRPKKLKRRYKEEKEEIAGSIRWLGEVVMRTERARMETMKEIERMRAETEAKRGEMDLKRTEIMANTQLEIARLFAAAASSAEKGVDSSLTIGRN